MKEFTFIRRYLELNRQEKTFTILRDVSYNMQADTYEKALSILVQQLDSTEGRIGVLGNNGFLPDYSTDDSKVMYIVFRGMMAHCYQENVEGNRAAVSSFREQLAETDDYKEEGIYQGFYADDQLLCPRALTVHRLQCCGDEFNYLFEIWGGNYNGEYDKYLFYEQVLYKGLDPLYSEIQAGSEQDV